MDPLTVWLFCLATAWIVRLLAEDAWAAVQGRESPRLARRRVQHDLAQQHQADTGQPTITRAVTGRIAQRIAKPRGRGALRRYLGELWEDGWVDAADSHRARRERRRRRDEAGPDAEEVVLESRPCPGGCGRFIAGELSLCAACASHRYEWPDDDPDDDIVDAEIVDDPEPEPEPADQPDPEPSPAPEPHRKDPSVSTPTTTIDGDTVSPLETLAFATSCLELNTAIQGELDIIAANLAAAQVGGGMAQSLHDAWMAADQFKFAAGSACDEYARHVATQADIAGDTELRDTVNGTYLDAARA